jgi:hypothetical protein
MSSAMMWGMGIVWVLVIIALVLGIAALPKFIVGWRVVCQFEFLEGLTSVWRGAKCGCMVLYFEAKEIVRCQPRRQWVHVLGAIVALRLPLYFQQRHLPPNENCSFGRRSDSNGSP